MSSVATGNLFEIKKITVTIAVSPASKKKYIIFGIIMCLFRMSWNSPSLMQNPSAMMARAAVRMLTLIELLRT